MRVLATLCALTAGSAATADQSCTFDRECLEGEDCAETTYELTLTDGSDGTVTLSDIAGDRAATATGRTVFAPTGDGKDGGALLTIAPDGTARYSLHMIGADLSILYLGQCEDG